MSHSLEQESFSQIGTGFFLRPFNRFQSCRGAPISLTQVLCGFGILLHGCNSVHASQLSRKVMEECGPVIRSTRPTGASPYQHQQLSRILLSKGFVDSAIRNDWQQVLRTWAGQ
jgi:hypothetical protein